MKECNQTLILTLFRTILILLPYPSANHVIVLSSLPNLQILISRRQFLRILPPGLAAQPWPLQAYYRSERAGRPLTRLPRELTPGCGQVRLNIFCGITALKILQICRRILSLHFSLYCTVEQNNLKVEQNILISTCFVQAILNRKKYSIKL